jgi:3-methyladenine DNA glycosylase AlkC
MNTNPIAPAPKRKGATRKADISPEILQQLNCGEIEAVTLVESLAIDYGQLLRSVAPEASAETHRVMQSSMALKIKARMQISGEMLLANYGIEGLAPFIHHRSDTVRSWAAMAMGIAPNLSLAQRLDRIADLADDPNAGVREWAWMALRPHVIAELDRAIAFLSSWVVHASPNLRRFATEVTRPRGVWCAHIPQLKQHPSLALPLLDPLHADPDRYVQNSVANWLNDAAKSQPQFVRDRCAIWQAQSTSKATQYICRRALRSLPSEP